MKRHQEQKQNCTYLKIKDPKLKTRTNDKINQFKRKKGQKQENKKLSMRGIEINKNNKSPIFFKNTKK